MTQTNQPNQHQHQHQPKRHTMHQKSPALVVFEQERAMFRLVRLICALGFILSALAAVIFTK